MKASLVFIVGLLLGWVPLGFSATMTRGPWIQKPTQTGMVIRWRTDVGTDSVVNWGLAPGTLDQNVTISGSRTRHTVTINGLNPDTKYFYQVTDSGGTFAVGGNAQHYLVTLPPDSYRGPKRFWFLGDAGTANQDQVDVRDAYTAFPGGGPDNTDLVIQLGDNAYWDGLDNEYQGGMFDPYGTYMRNTPFLSTRGNHENNTAVYLDVYDHYTGGEAGGTPSGTEMYYSFDYGNVHFVCLDSDQTVLSAGSRNVMKNWLITDLQNTTKEWIIAFWHHPPHTDGSHNSDNDGDSSGRMRIMREEFASVLEANGCDVILSGHSHSYERSFYLHGHYGTFNQYDPLVHGTDIGDGKLAGDGAYVDRGTGTVYVVTGSAGKATAAPQTVGPNEVFFYGDQSLGATIIDVDTNVLHAIFHDEQGNIDDEYWIVRQYTGEPNIETDPNVLNVTYGSADVSGNLISTGAAPATIRLYYGTTDGGFNPVSWDSFIDLGSPSEGALNLTLSNLTFDTTYFARFQGSNSFGVHWGSATATFTTQDETPEIVNEIIVPGPVVGYTQVVRAAFWKFLDDGSDQGSAWRNLGFNDTSWSTGQAELGYGDGDENTVVSFGPDANDRYPATYFRYVFNMPDLGVTWDQTRIEIKRDDGAVLYHNGIELLRENMPPGLTDFQTFAASTMDVPEEDYYFNSTLSVNHTVVGQNVIAASVHQRRADSSDISFDLELVALGTMNNSFGGPSNVTATAASLGGVLINEGISPATVTVYYGTSDGGQNPLSWDNSVVLGTPGTGPVNIDLTGLNPGTTYYYRYHAENGSGGDWAAPASSFTTLPGLPFAINPVAPPGGTVPTVFTNVPANGTWRYLDDGTDQGAGWRATGFDDTAWSLGNGQFGFGDVPADETTSIDFGADPDNKIMTFYFRHAFTITDLSVVTGMNIRLLRDEGAIVWLNDTQLICQNMRNDDCDGDFGDEGDQDIDDAVEVFTNAFFDASLLVTGVNTIAVSVHLKDKKNTTDMSFDLELQTLGFETLPGMGGIANMTAFSGEFCGTMLTTGAAPAELFILWDTQDHGADVAAWSNAESLGQTDLGGFCETLYNLPPNTNIFYRVYASNTFGGVVSLGTGSGTTLPGPWVNNNLGATAISSSDATLNGELGGLLTSDVTLYWGTSNALHNPAGWENSLSLGSLAPGTVATSVSNLLAGTEFYYTYYATNLDGEAWAYPIVSFTTLPGVIVATISAPAVLEGNTGLQLVRPRVDLSAASPVEVTMTFRTLPGSAFPGADYRNTNGILRIPPGNLYGEFDVYVVGDWLDEGASEFFRARISNPNNAVIGSPFATVVITDDDVFDSDGDGIEDAWEYALFSDLTTADATSDFDGDAFTDYGEYIAGTDPQAFASRLWIIQLKEDPVEDHMIYWPSKSGRRYHVESTTNLLSLIPNWSMVETNLPATPPMNIYTNANPGLRRIYYRIAVEKP